MDKRTFIKGEVVVLKAAIVLTDDPSNHVVDAAGARFTASSDGLETAELGPKDIAMLEDLLRSLHAKRRAEAQEAAAKAAAAAGPTPEASA